MVVKLTYVLETHPFYLRVQFQFTSNLFVPHFNIFQIHKRVAHHYGKAIGWGEKIFSSAALCPRAWMSLMSYIALNNSLRPWKVSFIIILCLYFIKFIVTMNMWSLCTMGVNSSPWRMCVFSQCILLRCLQKFRFWKNAHLRTTIYSNVDIEENNSNYL